MDLFCKPKTLQANISFTIQVPPTERWRNIEAEVKQGREKLNQLLMVKMQRECCCRWSGVGGGDHLCQHPLKKA